MKSIVENVVYQHAENVCSLWLQRQHAVNEPHYSFADIAHLDSRLDANIEGLRVAGHFAFPMIDEMIDAEDAGAHFAKALLAIQSGDQTTVNDLIELVDASDRDDTLSTELESALAWAQPDQLKDCVRSLLSASDSRSIILGLKTCASHNRDPSLYLEKHLTSDDPLLRETVLHVCADRGQITLAPRLKAGVSNESEYERYERARALGMLGDKGQAQQILEALALSDSALNSDASALFIQLSDFNQGRSLLSSLNDIPGRERDVIRGFGLLGDPGAMDWLIGKTSVPEFARLAGGAITMITGINLADADLETPNVPSGYEDGGITDNPADNTVALDEDEDLPWPDHELVSAWWHSSGKLTPGKPHLAGREKSHAEMVHVLANSLQRQRTAAAMSLALITPEAPYRDTRLPANKQKAWMT